MKKIIGALAILILFVGCSDKKESENEATQHSAEVTNDSKIEIEANENAQAMKVSEKEQQDYSQNGKNYYFSYGIQSQYDPNSLPANSDASVREKPRTKIDANLHVRSPYEKVQISLLVKKLSKEFMVKCSACHNDYANGIIGPSLLDKTNKEILKNISDFKTGVKSNPLMDDLIKLMSNQEIEDLANEIFEFNQKVKEMRK